MLQRKKINISTFYTFFFYLFLMKNFGKWQTYNFVSTSTMITKNMGNFQISFIKTF